jgi:hypothetical protein
MGFTNYSQPVEPAKWIAPIDLNLYAKGLQAQQEFAEKNMEAISNGFNELFSINAYGPDKRKLVELEQQFKQEAASLNLSDLSDINTFSKIKGLIGKYSSNSDVNAISERGSIYTSMMKEKKEAEKNGKTYYNRGMNTLSKYFGGQDYMTDLKYGNNGYTVTGSDEIMKKVKELVTPDEKIEKSPGGQYNIVKTYDPKKLKSAFDMVLSSNPTWKQYHRDQIEESLEGTDLEVYAKDYYSKLVTETNSVLDKLKLLKSQTKDPKDIAYYDNFITTYDKQIAEINKKLQNPYLGSSFKDEFIEKSISDDIEAMSEAIQFHSEGEIKMDESTRLNRQLGNQLITKQAEDISLGASMMGKSLSEVMSDPSLLPSAITLGQKAKLAEFSEKERVKQENRIAAKNEAFRGGFNKFTDSDTVTYTDEKGDSKTLQYGEFKKTIKEASSSDVKEMVAAVLNKKNQGDPQWQPITADDVKVLGTGEKRKFKINTTFGFFGDAVRYDEVIDISTFEGSNQAPSSLDEAAGSNPLDNAAK